MAMAHTAIATRTGMQWVAEYLVRAGVPYAVGIPGHGSFQLTDALAEHQDRIKMIPVLVLEVMIVRAGPEATYTIPAWWDRPVPAYRTEQRDAYLEARRALRL